MGSRSVVADFSGGYLSSDGGARLLRQVDRAVGLSRALAGCFVDQRDARFVTHGVPELVAPRLYALALGYEDLHDHADLRGDPLLAVAANKLDPPGTNRDGADQGWALAALRALLLQQGVRTLPKDTREVIVDFDATGSRLHGQQEGRFYHGYYEGYC